MSLSNHKYIEKKQQEKLQEKNSERKIKKGKTKRK